VNTLNSKAATTLSNITYPISKNIISNIYPNQTGNPVFSNIVRSNEPIEA
jgi:hypothetical protein